jgi:hypothetical protein
MTTNAIIDKFISGANAGTIKRSATGYTPLFIEGDTLFSYGHHYPLAKRVDGGFWVNSEKYSATTSKHASKVRYAIARAGLALVA